MIVSLCLFVSLFQFATCASLRPLTLTIQLPINPMSRFATCPHLQHVAGPLFCQLASARPFHLTQVQVHA